MSEWMVCFTAFYSAARMCGVFCILGHLLTFGWLLGYALEKILDYDVSTLGFLISLNFITGNVVFSGIHRLH